jgi:ribosome-associated heat shock protein Hsp15
MENSDKAGVRIDIWLDVACVYKTRSEAQKACKGGKVDVNGQTVKPNRMLRVGDELLIARAFGRKQKLVVRGLAERSVSKEHARLLYDDVTPPPSAVEVEMRRMERVFRAQTPAHSPDKRQRRALRRLHGKD